MTLILTALCSRIKIQTYFIISSKKLNFCSSSLTLLIRGTRLIRRTHDVNLILTAKEEAGLETSASAEEAGEGKEEAGSAGEDDAKVEAAAAEGRWAVSYTHLTLPTRRTV